ncbi:MAG: FHA domain-containing protein, partial [Rhodospirillales bacterium]
PRKAAVDMQNAISEHHKPLSIRVGYDVGPVIEEAGDLYGDTVNVASRMSQLAQPGQILATARALEFLPDHMKELARLLSGITVRGKTQVLNVGEIVWEFRDDVTMVGTGVEFGTDPDSAPVPTLRLRHSTGELVLVDGSEIKLGRSADCDILIVDPKASRMHASIERRRDKFVLIDRSANGTYVVLDDKREIHLKREEFTLSGGGVLGFGQSPRAPGADTVTFICE